MCFFFCRRRGRAWKGPCLEWSQVGRQHRNRLFNPWGKQFVRTDSLRSHIFPSRNIFLVKLASSTLSKGLTSLAWRNVGRPLFSLIISLTFFIVPLYTPTNTPLVPTLSESSKPKPELILFVGYPCLGKSSFYRRHLEPAGYKHINQDTLRTRDKCVREVDQVLSAGNSCVVGWFCSYSLHHPLIMRHR